MSQQIVRCGALLLELYEVLCLILFNVDSDCLVFFLLVLHHRLFSFIVRLEVGLHDLVFFRCQWLVLRVFTCFTFLGCCCIFSLLLPRLFILLFRLFEGLSIDKVGNFRGEYERILLSTNLNDWHQLLVLEEMAEVDMEKVPLESVDHDIVGVAITET